MPPIYLDRSDNLMVVPTLERDCLQPEAWTMRRKNPDFEAAACRSRPD